MLLNIDRSLYSIFGVIVDSTFYSIFWVVFTQLFLLCNIDRLRHFSGVVLMKNSKKCSSFTDSNFAPFRNTLGKLEELSET